MWVRSPLWDSCWLLNGLPIAAVIALAVHFGVPVWWLSAIGITALQSAHSIAPVINAWTHAEFRRRVVLRRPFRFIVFPIVLMLLAAGFGWHASQRWPSSAYNLFTMRAYGPMPWWVLGVLAAWMPWNVWHFGRQNYGVLSIYRRLSGYGNRRRDMVFGCGTAWAVLLAPIAKFFWHNDLLLTLYAGVAVAAAGIMLWCERCLPRAVLIVTNAISMAAAIPYPLLGLGVVGFNHWLTAIGLPAHTRNRPILFPLIAVALGSVIMCALFLRGGSPIQTVGAAFCVRILFDFVHFLYDRWNYKFNIPEVRDTMGRDMLLRRSQ